MWEHIFAEACDTAQMHVRLCYFMVGKLGGLLMPATKSSTREGLHSSPLKTVFIRHRVQPLPLQKPGCAEMIVQIFLSKISFLESLNLTDVAFRFQQWVICVVEPKAGALAVELLSRFSRHEYSHWKLSSCCSVVWLYSGF